MVLFKVKGVTKEVLSLLLNGSRLWYAGLSWIRAGVRTTSLSVEAYGGHLCKEAHKITPFQCWPQHKGAITN